MYLHGSILREAEEKHDREIDELQRQQPVRKRKSTTGENEWSPNKAQANSGASILSSFKP
jgi:hypothetical protein